MMLIIPKRPLSLFFSLSLGWLALSATSCLLTNELGLRPPGAVTGAELRMQAGEAAVLGFQLSTTAYCSRFSSGTSSCNVDLSDGKTAGSLLSLWLTPDFSGIEDGAFYTGESAGECLAAVQFQSLLLPNLFLEAGESTTSTGSITINSPDDKLKEVAILTSLMSGDACRAVLEEPGPLLYFSDNFDY